MADLDPTSTVSNAGTVSGAASAHAALSDVSDSSYVTLYSGAKTVVGLGTASKPAGAITRRVRATARISSISVNPSKAQFAITHNGVDYGITTPGQVTTTTPVDIEGGWVSLGDLTQAEINALRGTMTVLPSWTNLRYYEYQAEVEFAEKPTTTVDEPSTSPVTSPTFTISWTHTDGAGGGPQAAYWWKVFSDAQVAGLGFDPASTVPLYAYSERSSASSIVGELPEGSYRIYAITAQDIDGVLQWADWGSYKAVTVTLTTAEVGELTPTGVSDEGAVEIIVDRDVDEDDVVGYEIERSVQQNAITALGIDGTFNSGYGGTSEIGAVDTSEVPAGFNLSLGGGGEPASISSEILNSPGPWNGNYYRLGGTFDDGDRLLAQTGIGLALEVEPGDLAVVDAMIHTGGLTANTRGRLVLSFFDVALNFVSSVEAEFTGGLDWRPYWFGATVPEGARYVNCSVSIFGAAGASAEAALMSFTNLHLSKNVTWTAVRGAADIDATGDDQTTYFDYQAPPNIELRYRARAVTAAGSRGRWVYHRDPYVEWTMDSGVIVRSVDDLGRVAHVKFAEPPSWKRPQRRGVFAVAGRAESQVVSDVRSAREVPFLFQTSTEAEAAALESACEASTVVIHSPALGTGFWSLGDLEEIHLSRWVGVPYRRFRADGVEVVEP